MHALFYFIYSISFVFSYYFTAFPLLLLVSLLSNKMKLYHICWKKTTFCLKRSRCVHFSHVFFPQSVYFFCQCFINIQRVKKCTHILLFINVSNDVHAVYWPFLSLFLSVSSNFFPLKFNA